MAQVFQKAAVLLVKGRRFTTPSALLVMQLKEKGLLVTL
jgi:hypothetical protein